MDPLAADITGWPVVVIVVVVLAALAGFRYFMMGKNDARPLGSRIRKRRGIR